MSAGDVAGRFAKSSGSPCCDQSDYPANESFGLPGARSCLHEQSFIKAGSDAAKFRRIGHMRIGDSMNFGSSDFALGID